MPGLAARATTISRAIPPSRDADSTKAYVGYAVESLYPTAEEARITCSFVDAATCKHPVAGWWAWIGMGWWPVKLAEFCSA
jgi:hypothetical protein